MRWEKTFKMRKGYLLIIILLCVLCLNGCVLQGNKKGYLIQEDSEAILKPEAEIKPIEPENKEIEIVVKLPSQEIVIPKEEEIEIPSVEESVEKEEQTMDVKIQIGSKTYHVKLEDNETTQAFIERLPLSIVMSDLNRNEKYIYLDEALPSNAQNVSQINTGDLMLFGRDCLVLFYESFPTSYSYTRIGKLLESDDLKEVLGNGDAEITISY